MHFWSDFPFEKTLKKIPKNINLSLRVNGKRVSVERCGSKSRHAGGVLGDSWVRSGVSVENL